LVCDQAKAGLFAQPEDPRALASAIAFLADHPDRRAAMAASGRSWVLANATRAALADRYLAVLKDLVNPDSSPVMAERSAPSAQEGS
jgi:glycosyltransferase involved in cell wall biosynthesis